MTYYVSDAEGESLRLMAQEEMVQSYRQFADEVPTSLADLYVDFHDFSRVEFLVFKDRLRHFTASMAFAPIPRGSALPRPPRRTAE